MSQWIADSFVPPVSGYDVAERQVDGATDLLVEEDLAGELLDAVVGPDADLAEDPGPRVGVERLDDVVLVRASGDVDDAAGLELEPDALASRHRCRSQGTST